LDDNQSEYKVSRVNSNTSVLPCESQKEERRRAKTWNDREQIRKAHVPVTNLVPELSTEDFAGGEDFDATLQSYMAANYLCFMMRNSESREKYSSVYQVPSNMTYLFKIYWSTRASSHTSRGKGRRDRDCRYTGCEAGFTVRSVKSIVNGRVEWGVQIVQGTVMSLHNHKTSQAIYDSYCDAKLRQLAPEVRRELGLLTEMKVLSADINRCNSKHASNSGNDVLLVQDQLDITCIIVMETTTQKHVLNSGE
ncbi:Hypothetical protein PHPALM_10769, partial [Phytophthora palmivora]